jgi:hypothetical protein
MKNYPPRKSMASLDPISSALETIEKIAVHISILPYHVYKFAKARINSPEAQWKRKRRAELTQPKVVPRGRPLTPPLRPQTFNVVGGIVGKKETRVFDEQSSSLLLTKLPAEIRTLIYQEAILANTRRGNDITIGWSRNPSHVRPSADNSLVDILSDIRSLHKLDILNLLCSCRLVYSEMIDLLYSTPTFHFIDYHAFFGFCMIILPHRWEKVRHLDLQFQMPVSGGWPGGFALHHQLSLGPVQWLTARSWLPKYESPKTISLTLVLRILAEMKGLQSITVEFGKQNVGVLTEADLLERLKDMLEQRQAAGKKMKRENFVVVLGWEFREGTGNHCLSEGNYSDQWPFVLIRPTCARL